MSETCPNCGLELVRLYTFETRANTGDFLGTYDVHNFFGYWCERCQKMYVKKSKHWFEPMIFEELI
jgi:hypothetical protein